MGKILMKYRLLYAEAELAVYKFNEAHPVGTRVRIWPGVREGDGIETVTRSRAEFTASKNAVVWTEARPSCISLTHVEVIEKEA